MALWILLAIVFIAGGVGGLANALLSDNAFPLPKRDQTDPKIIRPGIVGNVFVSGVAACISWGLYGPFAAVYIAGGPTLAADAVQAGLTLSALVGSVLVGVGGARWLSNEVDKQLLRTTATETALTKSSPEKARLIAMATPSEALRIARQ